jgi:hypothetical protein
MFITPQIEVGAMTYLVLGLLEMLIALDVLPPQGRPPTAPSWW